MRVKFDAVVFNIYHRDGLGVGVRALIPSQDVECCPAVGAVVNDRPLGCSSLALQISPTDAVGLRVGDRLEVTVETKDGGG